MKMKKMKKEKFVVLFSLLVGLLFGAMQTMEAQAAESDQINLEVIVGSAIDITCPDPASFGTLTPGTPVTTSTTCTATTNAENGYDLQIKKDNTATLNNGSYSITDKTAWNSGTPNSAVWSGTGLGFRVMQTGTDEGYSSTWWGSDDTVTNAKYAGLPGSYVTILEDSTYSSSATDTAIGFKVDVPATQASGTYTGTATIQGVVNP
jgi:hypothetical protein